MRASIAASARRHAQRDMMKYPRIVISRVPAWLSVALALSIAGCGHDWSRFRSQMVGDGGEPGADAGSEWWDPSWSHRTRLTIDGGDLTEDLSDFPLLVVLSSPARFDRAIARGDGADLRFVDADGTTVLDHEIESWDVAGSAYVWVRIPLLRAGAEHVVWLYYGSPSAPSVESADRVWSAAHLAVWHLSTLSDSSGSGNTLSNPVSADAAPARIGIGRSFDGITDHLRAESSESLRMTTASLTLSGWIYVRTTSTDRPGADWPWPQTIVNRQEVAGANDFVLGVSNGSATTVTAYYELGATTEYGSGSPLGTWIHLAVTYDGSRAAYYQDGEEWNSIALTHGLTATANPVVLGGGSNGGAIDSEFLDGLLDEVRIERVARPASWIAAQHLSMTDALVTYERMP